VLPLVVTLAAALRLGAVLLSRGGLLGVIGYDPGVYYSSAAAITFGRLPYDDYVLLHPPGLSLVLVPFALVGRLTTDHTGFVVANIAFCLLGALNAGLVVVVARRWQLPGVAAMTGGLFYAVWYGSVAAEASIRLEPLGSCAFLCSLLAFARAGDCAASGADDAERGVRWWAFIAGAALGVASSVKIWWVVPLLLLAWRPLDLRPRREASLAVLAGAGTAVLVVCGPFFVNAPGAMWRMVVLDQLGRGASRVSVGGRLGELSSLGTMAGLGVTTELLLLAALTVLVVAAWRVARGRVVVATAVAQAVVLMTAPSSFAFYADYLAASGALVLALAVASRNGRSAAWSRVIAGVTAATVGVTGAVTGLRLAAGTFGSVPFPGPALARSVTGFRCVQSDSPEALIELDALSRDLAHGCANWVDVTGRTYDVDAPARASPRGSRATNMRWQRDLRSYLFSGDAVIVIRRATGLSSATQRLLRTHVVIRRSGGYVVYRVHRATVPRVTM
jgi:alpha-1,2-mannosyltransferase